MTTRASALIAPPRRDHKETIKTRADKLVSAAMVSAEVSAQTEITEKVTIEVEAHVRSSNIIGH
ncbi:MAG: hypothetical protein H7232_14960 [Aeromicrobium sp.]|nr:hypothetical protein [Burkholderiales bacterium]